MPEEREFQQHPLKFQHVADGFFLIPQYNYKPKAIFLSPCAYCL